MKKIFLLLAVAVFSFYCCEDNDDKDPVANAPENTIIGEWKLMSKRVGSDSSAMSNVVLAPCEDHTTLTFYNDNNLKQNSYGGDDCVFMTEIFTDWQHEGGANYKWGEDGNAGYVQVVFSANHNEMTTLRHDGADYHSETYARQ